MGNKKGNRPKPRASPTIRAELFPAKPIPPYRPSKLKERLDYALTELYQYDIGLLSELATSKETAALLLKHRTIVIQLKASILRDYNASKLKGK